MTDDRVLESLLDALDGQETVVHESLVRAVLRIAASHQFDADRSMAREKIRQLVTEFVDRYLAEESA